MEASTAETFERKRRAQWLAERRSGLGGSDAAAVLGLSPWASPLSVYLDKVGPFSEDDGPVEDHIWWGAELERLIARRYSEATGVKLWSPRRIFRHRELPALIGTPDYLAIGADLGVEIKNVDRSKSDDWGAEGSDEVPVYYLIQSVHYMAVLDLPRWDFAALFGGNDLRVYTVRRDRELEAALTSKLVAWWKAHVETREAPPPGGQDASALARAFPRDTRPVLQADDRLNALALQYAVADDLLSDAAKRAEEVKNEIKAALAEHSGAFGPGWKVSWKAARDGKKTDWRAVANRLSLELDSLGKAEVVSATLAEHTALVPGSRRFLFDSKEEK